MYAIVWVPLAAFAVVLLAATWSRMPWNSNAKQWRLERKLEEEERYLSQHPIGWLNWKYSLVSKPNEPQLAQVRVQRLMTLDDGKHVTVKVLAIHDYNPAVHHSLKERIDGSPVKLEDITWEQRTSSGNASPDPERS